MSTPEPLAPGPRPDAALAVRISPADVGRRVTVRHRVADGRLTDVVGTLTGWDGGWSGRLTVERRDGTPVEVAAEAVAAAKVVPPELSAESLQAVAETGWPPEETAALGDWRLRAARGVTGRANSVRLAGRPGVPADEALERVRRWYADRGLPPLVQVPVPSAYDEVLAAHGWEVVRRTTLLTAATDDVRRLAVPAPGVALDLASEPSGEWLALVEPDLDPEQLARILVRPREVVFVTARDAGSGALLGAGRASAAGSAVGRWAGITSVLTAPPARRRGVARTVVAGLAAWAGDHGCPHAYLQLLASNTGARALYDSLGFRDHHAYDYLSRPSPR